MWVFSVSKTILSCSKRRFIDIDGTILSEQYLSCLKLLMEQSSENHSLLERMSHSSVVRAIIHSPLVC